MIELSSSQPTAANRPAPALPSANAHIIALGNEKGGSGKSTTAIHLITALLYDGARVAAIDLDARQATLTRYLANRKTYGVKLAAPLPMPSHFAVKIEEAERLPSLLDELLPHHDFIVLDCPGSDTSLARAAHAVADTLVTPLNDSFIDFDVLATVDPERFKVEKPSHYSEMVWEQRKQRALQRKKPFDWVVLRNRLSQLDARNKQNIGEALSELARRIGFRLVPGFSERVVFRELFPKGLTLLDLKQIGTGLTMSQVAARQELRALIQALNLPVLAAGAAPIDQPQRLRA